MTTAAFAPSIEYVENGISLNFGATFRYIAASHLEVSRIAVDGAVTVLAYGSAWSATPGLTDAGGTVTLVATVAGARLRIRRVTPRSQERDWETGDTFPAETIEAAIDKLTLIDQEQDVRIADLLARAILMPDGEVAAALPAARAGLYLAFDALGVLTVSSGTGADAGLRTDLAAVTGAALVGYQAPGAGSLASSVSAHLDRVLHQDDYASYAQAEAAAGGKPLWCHPQTNSGLAGADTQIGLRVGHIVVGGPGDALNDVDAFVAFLAQETYANVLQEMRIGSFACRYHRAGDPDEATLGWDIRCLSATGVIDAANTEYLRGNMNPFTAEFIYDRPTSGSYSAKNTYMFATYLEVAGNVTLENYEGIVIKAPVGSQSGGGTGTIQRHRGIVIENLAQFMLPTIELCAIRLEGAADSGKIWWGNEAWITADVSGKMEHSFNDAEWSMVNAKVTGTAGAVFTYFDVIVNGTPGRIPVHALV